VEPCRSFQKEKNMAMTETVPTYLPINDIRKMYSVMISNRHEMSYAQKHQYSQLKICLVYRL